MNIKITYLITLLFIGSFDLQPKSFDILRELDIGARVSATYDSNLFGVSPNVFQQASNTNVEVESEDDLALNFSPSVHFSRKIYLLSISGSAGVSLTRYVRNKDKSFVVPVTTLSLDFDESLKKRLSNNAKIRFDASFDLGQHIDTSIADQDLVSYTYLTTNLNLRYNHSAKFGVGFGTSYTFKDYQADGLGLNSYNDLNIIPLSLRAFYIYSEKLDVFTDYTFTNSTSDSKFANAADSINHSFTVGLNGEYSSKLKGKIGLGYSWIDYEKLNLNSTSNLVSSFDLTWKHNSKTSSSYFINRQFAPTAQGTSTFSTNIGSYINHKLTDRLRGNANVSYANIEYTNNFGQNSKLDQVGLGFGIDFDWKENFIIGSSYSFSLIDYSSENYNRHTLTIYGSGRF